MSVLIPKRSIEKKKRRSKRRRTEKWLSLLSIQDVLDHAGVVDDLDIKKAGSRSEMTFVARTNSMSFKRRIIVCFARVHAFKRCNLAFSEDVFSPRTALEATTFETNHRRTRCHDRLGQSLWAHCC